MVDYSKWRDIEISDDEDETHPNIDTPSLFRWRHQARIERMEDQKKKKEEFESMKDRHMKEYEECKVLIKKAEQNGDDTTKLKAKFEIMEKEHAMFIHKEQELKKLEQTTPWNVDTISQPGFTKTVVNVPQSRVKEELSEEEQSKKLRIFIKENESLMKQYGMIRKYDDSKKFLQEHTHLVCDETTNYLVIWCINLEMEEKHNLMAHVAHQAICMQYIMELAKQLGVDPRSCVNSFFTRIQTSDDGYKQDFENEIESFKNRIVTRAQEKLDIALKEMEEEERKNRLGPGGLDPMEVYDSLPADLQKCFEKKDIPMLYQTLEKMEKEDAAYHMKRCIDSGLWVPDAKKKPTENNVTENDD